MNISLLRSKHGIRAFFLLFILHCVGYSQASDKVKFFSAGEGKEGNPLSIQVELLQSAGLNQILLVYRPASMEQYKELEMIMSGTVASVTIPGRDVKPSDIEYYFKLVFSDTIETYPRENPEAQAFRVSVRPADEKEQMIIFLSPEPGTVVVREDLLISISLFRVSSSVNKQATKIYISDREVTQFAVISEDLIVLAPENITPPIENGTHTVKINLYDNEGALYHSSTMSYTQVSLAEELKITEFQYSVSAQVEVRNENIQNTSTPYNRGLLNTSAKYGILKVEGRIYATNEEKPTRQPQNRFFVEASIPWLRAAYGDAYPVFPSLIMNGKRMRGLTSNLSLGFFNVDFAVGEITRKIDSDTVRTFPHDSLHSVQQDTARPNRTDAFGPYDTTVTPKLWAEYRRGTYTREITVFRPSFGSGKNFQWGFSYLKAKDDVGSINYGIKPKENIAFGSDLLIALDNRNLELTAQGAASVYNMDIAPGNLRDTQIDSLFTNDADSTKKRQDLKDIRNMISPFITVNQNLVPLAVEKLSSIFAYEGALVLNYFNNYFKAGFIFRGSEYNSFGQDFMRKDIRGFNIYDRARLFDNQIFVSFGFERLQDNTDGSKPATTTFRNFNSAVSYYPRINFPNVTVGYNSNTSSNGLIGVDTTAGDTLARERARKHFFINSIEDRTSRIYIQLGYDFTAILRHSVNLSVSTSAKDDKTYRNMDSRNTTVSGTVTTTWKIPLQTSLGISINRNKIPEFDPNSDATKPVKTSLLSDFNYTGLTFGGRYRMMQNKLQLLGTISPIFGDFRRMMWDFAAEYSIMNNLVASGQLSILQNVGISTDVIMGIILRYKI